MNVILSGVRPTNGRTNVAKNLLTAYQILRFVHFRSAKTYYAQNDIHNFIGFLK
jgi:hypothetical protein